MTTINTASLGQVVGITADGATQFLGIKYATLKDRFAEAEIAQHYHTGTLDATSPGPASVQPAFTPDVEFGLAQHSLPVDKFDRSDVDCLNLNITRPDGCTFNSKLPVLVFIHGGGLFLGSNSWPQYRMSRFVKLSADKGVPTIVVTINYRLGMPGFLTSEELRQAGYKPNNGIRDQRAALLWIRKYIHEFGGDPQNITAAGQSAGGASVTYHLHSHEPLFKRILPISGTAPLMTAVSYDFHERSYKQAISALGLADASPAERINSLLTMSAEDLISKIPNSVPILPAIDNEIIFPGVTQSVLENVDTSVLPGLDWCQDLLIGENEADCSIIGAIIAPHVKINPAKRFIEAVVKALASYPDIGQEILQAYGITKDTTDEIGVERVFNFFNDIRFHAPALNLARNWKGTAYVYHFNEGNPWEGPWKGRANHILDVFYLFQNFTQFLNQEQREVGTAMAHDILKFCHGIAPWPAIKHPQIESGFSARVYGPSQEGHITRVSGQAFGGETMRRRVLFDSASKTSWPSLLRIYRELISP